MQRLIQWIAVLLTVTGLQAVGPIPKIAKDLAEADKNKTVNVIVQFDKSLDQKALNKIRAKLVKKAKAAAGVKKTDLDLISGTVVRIKAKHLHTLADEPAVEFISPDRGVTAILDHATPTVGADIARQYGWDGAGIGVAVIDSGIHHNADFGRENSSLDRVVYDEGFPTASEIRDECGHGTHVAGIIAGEGNDSGNVLVGVAPEANLINLRALDADGRGTDSTVIAAIQRAIELQDQHNIRVINLSLGRPVY